MSFTLKKTTFLAFSSMLVFAFSSSSFADSCDALLKAGIYNTTQSSSAEDSQSLAKSTFCSADYSNTQTSSSQRAAINASYGLFSGGASGAASDSEIVTKQSQVCTSGFNSSAYSNQASYYSRTVYQGSLDAWNQCQALAGRGVIFETQLDSGLQGVSVTLSTVAGTSGKFLGMSQMGTGRFLCRTTLPARGTSLTGKVITIDASTAFTFDSASKLTINCQRQMIKDAANNLNADAQTLVFNTSAGAYQVPMAAIGSLSRTSVDKAMAQISAAALANVQAALSVTNQNVAQVTTVASQTAASLNALASQVNALSANTNISQSLAFQGRNVCWKKMNYCLAPGIDALLRPEELGCPAGYRVEATLGSFLVLTQC